MRMVHVEVRLIKRIKVTIPGGVQQNAIAVCDATLHQVVSRKVIAQFFVGEIQHLAPTHVTIDGDVGDLVAIVVHMVGGIRMRTLVAGHAVVFHVQWLACAVRPAANNPIVHDTAGLGAPDRGVIVDRQGQIDHLHVGKRVSAHGVFTAPFFFVIGESMIACKVYPVNMGFRCGVSRGMMAVLPGGRVNVPSCRHRIHDIHAGPRGGLA